MATGPRDNGDAPDRPYADSTGEQALLWILIREWRRIQVNEQPWGFWVREYDLLPPGAAEIDAWKLPRRCCFVDDHGPREQSVWTWARFLATRASDQSDAGRQRFRIGRAAFAAYDGSDACYAEVQWAPGSGGDGVTLTGSNATSGAPEIARSGLAAAFHAERRGGEKRGCRCTSCGPTES